MLTLSAEMIVELTGGELLAGSAETVVNGLSIDSREVQPGAAFVAFAGEKTDGHEHIGAALESGARAILVTRDDEGVRAAFAEHERPESALVLIDDSQRVIEALAAWHRDRLHIQVIGITGSTGK
ncbi:MAG: Mur ligase domain-containing protein, partial [Coriobacteriia bacterium]